MPLRRIGVKILSIDLERCVGCQNCELTCSFYQMGDFKRERSNIWVHLYPEERFVATLTCVQCEKPICVKVCPNRALGRDPETNAVVVDESRCLGCKMCMQACPFGSIHMNRDKHVVEKCNLCEGDPKCVRFCMGQAINYVEIDEMPENKRKSVDRKLRKLYPGLSSEKM
jgi:Fe-S-cluster-containing dehydrogenase component